MKNPEKFKKFLPDLIVIISFILISFIYFAPAVLDGRVITQHDSLAAIGQGQEQRDFMARHDGERTRWNLSMFGGMPSYQMSPTYDSTKPQDLAKKAYQLFLPDYVFLVFIMSLGFYILMRAFKASPLISALGAIVCLSCPIFHYYAAGISEVHHAGIYSAHRGWYIYRKKYPLGALLVMIFACQVSTIQMSYYFSF